MGSDERRRQRVWAPKVRTGCENCKLKRIKCCETKPRCRYCERKQLVCQYHPPKARLFETAASQRAAEAHPPTVTQLCSTLQTPWGSPGENQALQFYLAKVGPWLCGYGPFEGLELWNGVLPRVAASLPALKHLLLALAIIEAPIHDPTEYKVRVRSESIIRHYTKGVQGLRKPRLSYAESALGPILAFAIEVFKFDMARCKIHLRGATLLHEQAIKTGGARGASLDDFVHDSKHRGMLASMHMFVCLRAKVPPYTAAPCSPDNEADTDDAVYTSLSILHSNVQPTSSAAVRAALSHYFTHVFDPDMSPAAAKGAQAFLLRWQGRVLQTRFRSAEAGVVFNALDLLCNLAMILLPLPLVVDGALDDDFNDRSGREVDPVGPALGYVVQRCRWMLGRCLSEPRDRANLHATVRLILGCVVRYAPVEQAKVEARWALELVDGDQRGVDVELEVGKQKKKEEVALPAVS